LYRSKDVRRQSTERLPLGFHFHLRMLPGLGLHYAIGGANPASRLAGAIGPFGSKLAPPS
jgi:hypothetical protein